MRRNDRGRRASTLGDAIGTAVLVGFVAATQTACSTEASIGTPGTVAPTSTDSASAATLPASPASSTAAPVDLLAGTWDTGPYPDKIADHDTWEYRVRFYWEDGVPF